MSGLDNLPVVSVIIPTYNRADLLRLTVDSVLAQTYPAIEIIVVDDGSTDHTTQVMVQYGNRVTFMKTPTNKGGNAARNLAVSLATGDYFIFLDHDDLMLPTKVERQVQILAARPEIGLVHCGYYYIDEHGNRLDKTGILPEGDVLKELLLSGCFIWSGGPMMRRQCLEAVGDFDDLWSSDYDMWLRVAVAGYPFACIQEPLGAYRILLGSEMSNVFKLEECGYVILDKVFSDPNLPADIAALKDQVYSKRHVWLSCKYYAVGLWDDARRNLAEALRFNVQLLDPPDNLLTVLRDEALDPRITDPVKFMTDVFDHLPPAAESLQPYRSYLLGQIYLGLSLHHFALGNRVEAAVQLAEAIKQSPAILEQPDDFADLLYRFAMRLSAGDPLAFVDTVLQNLPAGAERLAQVRSRVLGNINIGCAFQDYFAGRHSRVVRQVLTGVRYQPSSLKNRGVVSMFLKSLLGRPVRG
jgi:glycosyltransferase involved in cell wall biosynthesis